MNKRIDDRFPQRDVRIFENIPAMNSLKFYMTQQVLGSENFQCIFQLLKQIALDNIGGLNIGVCQEASNFYTCVAIKPLRVFSEKKDYSSFQILIFDKI